MIPARDRPGWVGEKCRSEFVAKRIQFANHHSETIVFVLGPPSAG